MKDRWMYLLFPQMCLQQVISSQPDAEQLTQQPVALVRRSSQRHIWQANKAAQNGGVLADMPLTTALCLCPQLQLLTIDAQQQAQMLNTRASWAGQFSAFISPDPPQGLWLEVASMLRLFHGMNSLHRHIIAQADAEHWSVQTGLGQTPLAARLRAHLQLLPATDNHDLPHLTVAQLQQGLPLSPEETYRLQRLGIKRLADIQRLPLTALSSRLGTDFSQRIRRLLGYEPHPLPAFHNAEVFQQQAHFIHEVEHSNGLLFPLQRLLQRLSEFLQRRQLSTRQLNLQLSHRHLPDSEWQIRFAHGEYEHSQLVFMVRHFLEQRRLPAPVQSLILNVSEFIERERGQKGLLTSKAEADSTDGEKSGQLLNRLASRLQPEQLLRLQVQADPRPEQASIFRPADDLPAAAHLHPGSAPRPLWLLPAPLPCPAPQQIISGPERVCSGWWDDNTVRRDYYVVCQATEPATELATEKQSEQLLWVFHSPQGWFIHGLFS